ncbi:MAG: DnaJ domain-containing protein [Alphaproteobacteria bacterium]|nr:DnaJ domain-containing protein [Alphaproteobacteria bacterium]
MFNPYATLSVSPNESLQAIRAKYAHIIKKKHPDTASGSSDPQNIENIMQAFSVLKSHRTRKLFDDATNGGKTFSDYSAFAAFMHKHIESEKSSQTEHAQHALSITISLQESLLGTTKKITFLNASIHARIPPNTRDATVITIEHKTSLSRVDTLFLKVFVASNPLFSRTAQDLIMQCPISFADSLHGNTFSLTTPLETLNVHIPTLGSFPFAPIVYKNHGVEYAPGVRGNLIMHPVIVPPKKEDPAAHHLAEILKNTAYKVL